MNKLELITTETFGEIECEFFRNQNNEIFFTRKQLGEALGYKHPEAALSRIHKRHKDRLDEFSVIRKLRSTDGKFYNNYLYSERGVMEICRWSRQSKADEFMDWAWSFAEPYKKQNQNEIITNFDNKSNANNTPTKMTYISVYSIWKSILYKRIDLLECPLRSTRKEVLSIIYRKLAVLGFKIKDLKKAFCTTHNTKDCYPIDAIQDNQEAMDVVDKIVDSMILNYNILTLEELEKLKQENNILNIKGEEN